MIGYFCTYTPVEVIHAAGFVPVRITGGQGRVERAYSLIPDFICPYMKRAMEKTLAGEYDFLKGLVQGYTCDIACGMVGVWNENTDGKIFHTVSLPYNESPQARIFFKAEINRLADVLGKIGGTFSLPSLEKSLDLYDNIRNRLHDLLEKRLSGRHRIQPEAYLSIVLAGMVMPPKTYMSLLERFPDSRDIEEPESAGNDGVPVLVSGSLIELPEIFSEIQSFGGHVVAEDLCTGSRMLYPPESNGGDPLERLMNRYFQRIPCPARTRAKERAPILSALAENAGARGIVFLTQKFCTPHLADIPIVAAELKERNLPSILIEIDEGGCMEGQARTRLESFFEMLR